MLYATAHISQIRKGDKFQHGGCNYTALSDAYVVTIPGGGGKHLCVEAQNGTATQLVIYDYQLPEGNVMLAARSDNANTPKAAATFTYTVEVISTCTVEVEAASEEEAIEKACEMAWQLDADETETRILKSPKKPCEAPAPAKEPRTYPALLCEVAKGDKILFMGRIYIAASDAYLAKTDNGMEWNVEVKCEEDPCTFALYASDFDDPNSITLIDEDTE